VALPFLVVMTVIIESAIVLRAGQVLQTSATSAARLVLTGQAQNAGYVISGLNFT
jgi:Flp pilus assembly protein TadG